MQNLHYRVVKAKSVSKTSLSPLLEMLKDDETLRQKLASHLALDKDQPVSKLSPNEKDEKKKKKKKDKDREKSASKSRYLIFILRYFRVSKTRFFLLPNPEKNSFL